MKVFLIFLIFLFNLHLILADQPNSALYNYTCVGNCNNFNNAAVGSGGLMLAGGGTDVDNAFIWFIKQAGGGDLVVLRTSGADGYDEYLYTLVPGGLNSVSTFVMMGIEAASDSYLLSRVGNATAIFWAGGDQWTYYSYAKQTPLQQVLQNAISPFPGSTLPSKHAVYGGTSAGCAIQGEYIFTAEFDTIVSSAAVSNPYDSMNTIGTGFVSSIPLLNNIITDTHYAQRDRAGRTLSWLGRLYQDVWTRTPLAVALNEASAVLIQPDGKAFFQGQESQSAVYLMSLVPSAPLVCAPKQSLQLTANVLKMAVNGEFFYDFSTRTPISTPSIQQYTLNVAKNKVTSSSGSVY